MKLRILLIMIFCLAAGLGFSQTVKYPEEWGPNLALEDNGGYLAECSSTGGGDESYIIDGEAGEGNHWEPVWDYGRPYYFVIELSKEAEVGVLQFTTYSDMDDGGVFKDIEVYASVDGSSESDFELVYQASLENEKEQVVFVDNPFRAKYIMIKILSDYGARGGELGEFAVFEATGAFAASRDSDVINLQSKDRLAGTIKDTTFVLETGYGRISLNKKDIESIKKISKKSMLVQVTLWNSNKFTGFLQTKELSFTMKTGSELKLHIDQISRIYFKLTEGTVRKKDPGFVVTLVNGDRFNVNIGTKTLIVKTSYDEITINMSDVVKIVFLEKDSFYVEVTLADGTVIRGVVFTKVIDVTVFGSSKISINLNSLESLEFIKPEPVLG